MMIGNYPCCDAPLAIAMPTGAPSGAALPAYHRESCPHCGKTVWHRLSRVEPMSWAEADFLAEHDVDQERGIITAKPGTDAERFDRLNRRKSA